MLKNNHLSLSAESLWPNGFKDESNTKIQTSNSITSLSRPKQVNMLNEATFRAILLPDDRGTTSRNITSLNFLVHGVKTNYIMSTEQTS